MSLPVDTSRVHKAAAALLKHVQQHKARKAKRQLVETAEPIFVTIGLHTTPRVAKSFKAKPIAIPHSLRPADEGDEYCLLVKNKAEAQKWLSEHPVPEITKVIALEKLRREYKTFQSRRELVSSYSAFLADDRIVCMLPKTLGREFYRGTARPLPLRLATRSAAALPQRVRRVLDSAYFYPVNGSCHTVWVGLSSFTPEQIAENVEAVLRVAVEKCIPQKWRNVQAIYLKAASSVALPLFQSAPDAQTPAGVEAARAPEETKKAGTRKRAATDGAAEQQHGEEEEEPGARQRSKRKGGERASAKDGEEHTKKKRRGDDGAKKKTKKKATTTKKKKA